MKKLSFICIIIVGLVIVAGCIGQEKAPNSETKTSINSQTNQNSDTQNPDLILKPSDVPDLTFGSFELTAIPKESSRNFVYTQGNYQITDTGMAKTYKDTLPLGYRNVGQAVWWADKAGRSLKVGISKFDSISGVNQFMDYMKTNCKTMKKGSAEVLKYAGCDSPNIGDDSFYNYFIDKNTNIQTTSLAFAYKNYYVTIETMDDKDKSLDQTIRIAKLIKSRLD